MQQLLVWVRSAGAGSCVPRGVWVLWGAGGCCITRYRESSEPVAEASLWFMWSHLLRENMEGWGGLSWEAAEPQGWSFILIKGGKKKKRLGFKSVPSH